MPAASEEISVLVTQPLGKTTFELGYSCHVDDTCYESVTTK